MSQLAQQNPCTPVKSPHHQAQHSPYELNPSQDAPQINSSQDSNSIQNSHQQQSLAQPIDEEESDASQMNNNEEGKQENQATPDGEAKNNKPQSTGQKQTERKRRRKKIDADGRDYTCSCGKSYLSYPALYTHVKTKHNGEISITQNLRIPLAPSNPMTESRQNLHSIKKQSSNSPRAQLDQDHLSIQKIKQFIYKQFIKDRPKEALIQFKNSLRLREEEKAYVNHIMKIAEFGDVVKVEESREGNGYRQFGNSGSKSENLIVDGVGFGGSDATEVFGGFGANGSPQTKRFQRIHVIRTVVVDKNFKENNNNNRPINNNNKSQRKGLISCIFPSIPETTKRSSNRQQDSSIDQVLGHFLNEFLKGVASNELINMAVVYFVCRVKDFYEKESKRINTSEKSGDTLIEQSGDLVGFLIEMENTYLKQPIVVCKVLFFFYRWMFKQQFTCRYVRFNQAG